MRNTIVNALAAFLFLLMSLTGAQAAGLAMAKGLPPETAATVLALHIERSLSKDKSGNAIIEGTECSTPKMFFDAIRQAHPNSRLGSVGELPAYLRTLLRKKGDPEDSYRMGRIIQHKDGTCRLDAQGWTRPFFSGEYAWYDPNTGEPVLAGDCGNVIGELAKRRAEVVPHCVELAFNAPVGGQVRWGIGSTRGPMPPDACNAQRQDSGAWDAWYGQCDVCVAAIAYIQRVLGAGAEIYHRYLYGVTERHQILRFSTAVWTKFVYICLEDSRGARTCGVYMRPEDWKGRYHVDISDQLWRADDGNCPQ